MSVSVLVSLIFKMSRHTTFPTKAQDTIAEAEKKESQDIIVDKKQDNINISTLTLTLPAKGRCCEVVL